MTLEPALEPFARMAARDDAALRLDLAALEIARVAYPDLEDAPSLDRLQELADRTRDREGRYDTPLGFVGLLNRSLFEEEGFHGDRESYYSPKNSCLNEVLTRRSGIPITLAVIYLEVARRMGHPVHGIGFPGHFLLRAQVDGQAVLLDPFDGGRVLTPEDCQDHLDRAFGAGVEMDPRFLRPVGTRQILTRMLRNLKRAYLALKEHERARAVAERLVLLRPDLAEELRDRGKLRLQAGRTLAAADDLHGYLEMQPDAADAPEIRLLLGKLRQAQARIN